MQNILKSSKKLASLLTASCVVVLLSGCESLKQTPVEQQDSVIHPQFQVTYTEDRITINLKKKATALTAEQLDYINRFVTFYKNSKDSVFFVSMLKNPDETEGSKLPFHNPAIMQNFDNIVTEVSKQGKRPHIITEVDTDTDETEKLENKGDVKVTVVPSNLDKERKVAIIVRQYTVKPANCPQLEGWDWNTAERIGHRNTIGCAVSNNLLAQIKDKSRLVYGETLDKEYYSAYDLTRLKEVNEGTFDPQFEDTSFSQSQ